MLQHPSGQHCLVIEPGQGDSQGSLVLLPRTSSYLAAGPPLLAELPGFSTFSLKLWVEREWGEMRTRLLGPPLASSADSVPDSIRYPGFQAKAMGDQTQPMGKGEDISPLLNISLYLLGT